MLHRPMSRAWIAGSALCVFLLGSAPARAQIYYETAYYPTSSIVTLPTSSVLATSYVVPTAYSTTYLPTSAVYSVGEVYTTSATYVPTYRTFRYRPRRYVERSYLAAPSLSLAPTSYVVPTSYLLPTSYVVPTTYLSSSTLTPTSYLVDNGLVATSATTVCEESTAPAPAPARTSASRPSGSGSGTGANDGVMTSQPSNGSSNERQPQGSVDDGTPSNVDPTPPAPNPPPSKAPAGAQSGGFQEPPAVNSGTGAAPTTPAPTNGGVDVPLPPPGTIGDKAGTTSRSSLRPTYDGRNILRGKVVSFGSGQPEEGVTVIVSSLTKKYADRPAMTDAFGEFKIALPEGDWSVKVKMPSGTLLPVASDYLTASNGRVVDGAGRNVKEFLITR